MARYFFLLPSAKKSKHSFFPKSFLIPITIILFLVVPFSLTWPKVYTDIEKYNQYMSFEKDNADDRWNKFGMDETIWPQKITDNMKVEDYKMIYYNPWDAQYLGYLGNAATPFAKEEL